MRFAGIDIGAETHVVAAVDEAERVLIKPTKITEDASGYERLLELLGEPRDTLVAMEATGHYWKNLFATLAARGFVVALLNPLRTARFRQRRTRAHENRRHRRPRDRAVRGPEAARGDPAAG